MKKCIKCRFFKVDAACENFTDDENKFGRCEEIEGHLDVAIRAGWEGGVLDYIEINEPIKFYCSEFQSLPSPPEEKEG